MQIYQRVHDMMKNADAARDKGLTTPEDIERFDDIAYGADAVWNLLDVYRPKSEAVLPVLVSVHGGGWVYGDKDGYQFYCMELARHGFVVVNFSYRLSPQVQYPEHLADVNNAMHWAAEHIGEYGGDASKICMIGDSAGAQMAAMYACALTNPECRRKLHLDVPEVKLKGIVLNCGAYDMVDCLRRVEGNATEDEAEELIATVLGKRPQETAAQLGMPSAYITSEFPPTFVMSSNGDFLRNQQTILLYALRAQDVLHVYHEYGSEEEMLWHVFHCNIRTDAARKCNDEECAFLRHCTGDALLKKTPEEYAQCAMAYFQEGYNCSQSVFLAFAEELGFSKQMAARLSSSFGGGMGRLREVCGAVSGMFMVAGILCGYDDPQNHEEKTAHYKRIQDLAARFREKNGSIVCRELLGLEQTGASHHVPEKRTEEYYKKRPCKELVGMAAQIVAEYFSFL